MTTTEQNSKPKAKPYHLKGEILAVRETVRQNGESKGAVDAFVSVKTKLNDKVTELTVAVAAGKPMTALRDKLVNGAMVTFFGAFEPVPVSEAYPKGGRIFRAFSEGGRRAAAEVPAAA